MHVARPRSWSQANRASAWFFAGRRNGSRGGGGLVGSWTLAPIHDHRDAPAIWGPRRQAGIAEAGTCHVSHRRELTVGARTPDAVGRRSRLRGRRPVGG